MALNMYAPHTKNWMADMLSCSLFFLTRMYNAWMRTYKERLAKLSVNKDHLMI